jgi:hypothetical protein
MKIRCGIAGLLVATSVMILVAASLSANADDPSRSPEGPLINIGSGKCFEPTPQGGPSNWAGLPIQQRPCAVQFDETNNRRIQQYRFESQGFVAFNDQGPWWLPCWGCIPAGDEGFFIRNLDTNLCLDARDGAKKDSSVVQQWTCRDRNARSMVWYIEHGDFPGMFKVRNFNSDLCLDVRGGSWDEFAQLQQFHCTSNNVAQNFFMKYPLGYRCCNLNGSRWTDGSTKSAVISEEFIGAIVVDMSAFNRPAAQGWFVDGFTIKVNFPDDATYTGGVSGDLKRITWSNGSLWVRKP